VRAGVHSEIDGGVSAACAARSASSTRHASSSCRASTGCRTSTACRTSSASAARVHVGVTPRPTAAPVQPIASGTGRGPGASAGPPDDGAIATARGRAQDHEAGEGA
jgi:hypothetical protein